MVVHLLDDCWFMMGRAEERFNALYAEIVRFLNDNVSRLVVEDDHESGEKVVYFAQEPPIPREWGADVGEIANAARTALDHLIYALAVKGGGGREPGKTAFPIFEDRDEYWKTRGRGARKVTVRDSYLAGVEEEWRKRVDAVQPYRHGDRAWRDPLAVVAEIANTHKHKMLKAARIAIATPAHICFATGANASELIVRFDPRRNDHVRVQTKVEHSHYMRDVEIVMEPLDPSMQVKGQIGISLVFGGPPRYVSIAQVMQAVQWSRSIIRWFEPAFDPRIEPKPIHPDEHLR